MFKRILEILKLKSLARQLRKPGGAFGDRVGQMMNRANAGLYQFTFEQMQPGYYERILEIGFGNGKFFEELSRLAEGLEITGIDYSPTMVRSAQKNNEELIKAGSLKLLAGDCSAMPFPDNHFHKAFCINVAYFWDDPARPLKEILRVLQPGGRLYVTVRTIESMERMPFTKYGFRKYDEAKWKELTTTAGFEWIASEHLTEPVSEFQPDPRPFTSVCYISRKPGL